MAPLPRRAAAASALALVLGACAAAPAGERTSANGPSAGSGLTRFGDCAGFVEHMRRTAHDAVTPDGLRGYAVLTPDGLVHRGRAGGPVLDRDVEAARWREPGVGHVPGGEVAVTDGRWIVLTDGGISVNVGDLRSGRPRKAGATNVVGTPQALALDGDRLLVVGELIPTADEPVHQAQPSAPEPGPGQPPVEAGDPPGPRPEQAGTALSLLDLSGGGRPRLLGTAHLSGRVVNVRSDGGITRIFMATQPGLEFPAPAAGERERAGALARNRATIDEAGSADWLPLRRVLDAEGNVRAEGPALHCTDVLRPAEAAGVDLLTFLQVDLRSADPLAGMTGDAVVANGDLAGFSTDGTRAYVGTQPDRWWRTRSLSAPRATEPRTAVHALGLAAGSRSTYLGSATVAGYLPGTGALSGRGAALRVAAVVPPTTAGGRAVLRVSRFDLRADGLLARPRSAVLSSAAKIRAVQWFDGVAAVVPEAEDGRWRLVGLDNPAGPTLGGWLRGPTGPDAYLAHLPGDRLLAFDGDPNGGRPRVDTFAVAAADQPRLLDTLTLYSDIAGSRSFAHLRDGQLVVFSGARVRHVTPEQAEAEEQQVLARCRARDRRETGLISHCVGPGTTQVQRLAQALQVESDGSLRLVGTSSGDASPHSVLAAGDRVFVADNGWQVWEMRAPELAPRGRVQVAEDP